MTMNPFKITDNIYYVGVDDRRTHRFENLWPLPGGVSYNSYLVCGEEKTALIDGTEVSETAELISHIADYACGARLDYLVVNHMEPDHTGAIPFLLDRFPEMKLIGNRQTVQMLAGFYGVAADRCVTVADKEAIDLGGLSLRFFLTPMVHWPETMMTYCQEHKVLFSGDAFGEFGALNGTVIDTDADVEPYFEEMYRYYANIVAKYGRPVQAAFAKLKGLEIDYACPTHGLMWHTHLERTLGIYDRLSSWTPEEGTVIVYGSMYGTTKRMAEYLADRCSEAGLGPVKVHSASFSGLSYILADCVRHRNIILGSATYSMELFPPMEALMRALQVREIKNKNMAAFSSYTWAPNVALNRFKAYAETMGIPLSATAQMKQALLEDVRPQLDAIVDALRR